MPMSKDMSNNSTNQRVANCPIVGFKQKFIESNFFNFFMW